MLQWYWEPAHYRKELGDLMLEAIEGTECVSAAQKPLAGVVLTGQNTAAHHPRLAADLASYRATHATEYEALLRQLPLSLPAEEAPK